MQSIRRSVLIIATFISILHTHTASASQGDTFELPFVISICAYNNAPWVEKNLNSIFSQNYTNFRVVYIDDASIDDNAVLVQEYIDRHKLHDKMTLIANPVRQRKMKNIYNLFHTFDDKEIIVQVDGDDWLAHDNVLATLNATYQSQGVWLTYGQFIGHDGSKEGICWAVPKNVIANRSFRSWPHWVYTHLRTFSAWLFKNIKLEDVINEKVPGFEGKFFPLGNDAASYFPMLEMCGNKFAFIPDILYIYNRENPYLTAKLTSNLIMPASKDIRSRPVYPQVKMPITNRLARYKHAKADLIVLSNTGPESVTTFLNSISDHVTGIENIYVLYEQKEDTLQEYKQIQKIYSGVQCIPIQETQIKEQLLTIVNSGKQEHIILSHDAVCVVATLDVHECIRELERTFAYGFYLGFAHTKSPFYSSKKDKELISHEHIYQDLYAWKFQCEEQPTAKKQYSKSTQALYNNVDMTLLRKSSVIERIKKFSLSNKSQKQSSTQKPSTSQIPAYTHPITRFIDAWQQSQHPNMHNVGLFFENLKVTKGS